MANGFTFQVKGANATLAYSDSGGLHTASIRVKNLSYNYGVSSTESHARDDRAFYPHRRVQGQFKIIADCIHYKEFNQLMAWLRVYAEVLSNAASSSSSAVTQMDVRVPSRNFHRTGILTTGIDDHDQTGSMVFNPELVFVSISDPADKITSLLTPAQASTFSGPQIDSKATLAFYPVSSVNYKDALLYDDLSGLDKLALAVLGVNPSFDPNNTQNGDKFQTN